jgi:Na+/H+-dicarboxylate symporter
LAYTSGTYFPKTVVTLAAFLIFNLLAGATAKLVMMHAQRAGKAFGVIFLMYLVMAIVSLIYVAVWIPFLTSLPFTQAGVASPTIGEWFGRVGNTFANIVSQQPLVQALVGAVALGFLTAGYKPLHPIAYGFIKVGDVVLRVFKWLLWYYPIMIMCLAIGIPMKFGAKGMEMYGQTVLWIAIVTLIWSAGMILLVKLTTKRTFKQIFGYYGTVWPTGLGTSGSYDTLAVNIISAEHDLGLHKEIAEVSIVFGTVLNKNCSTMAILLVTITVARLLGIPISETEIIMLIPPVMILGLESPGIPGGPGFFMAPIIGALMAAPDLNVFVTTFVTVYSGLVPMFTTAGNTTDDGVIGCFLQDLFSRFLPVGKAEELLETKVA